MSSCLVATLLWRPGHAGAAHDLPVPASNLTPFTAVLGQPSLRSATLARAPEWQLDMALASHSAIGRRGGDFAFVDGETWRLALGLHIPLSSRWELGLTLPWVSHQGGFLDGLVDTWHDFTGLQNGQRDVQGEDRILFAYQGPGGTHAVDRRVSGTGDVRVELTRALVGTPRWRAAFRLTAELPTGDAGRLTGNDAIDLAVDLLLGGTRQVRDRPLSWHTHAGLLAPGHGDLLPGEQRRLIGFAGGGLAWRWRPGVSLFVQAALTTDPWLSEVKELGAAVLEFTAGMQFHHRTGSWHLGLSEDLQVDSSPDVVFRFGWRSQASSP